MRIWVIICEELLQQGQRKQSHFKAAWDETVPCLYQLLS